MTTIKIDKSTIKKNPNAGETQSHFCGEVSITFAGVTTKNEIERLQKTDGVLVTRWGVGADILQ